VHEKLATVKINAKGEKSSAIVKISAKTHKEETAIEDETRIWFSLKDNRTIFAKVRSNDYLKVHLDNGIH
jgi:hypothetical protein